jgi:hypothetical protein
MASIEKFIERMDYYCRVASVGYDWGRRYDLWDGGDTDCSALVIGCLKEAGFDTGDAITTRNMSAELTARGWERLAPNLSTAVAGDILLNDANHVAAVLWGEGWGATIGQASIGETGDVYGNQPGDQTGWETNETGMYNYPWDCILRYTGEQESEDDMTLDELMGHEIAIDGGGKIPFWQAVSWAYTYAKQANEKADKLEKQIEAITIDGVDVKAVAKAVNDDAAKRLKQ